MSAYLDIISGTIIGGVMLLIALGVSEMGTRKMFNYNADAILQNNISRMAEIINYDLGKMGFAVPDVHLKNTIQVKQPDHLKYLVQLNMSADTYYAETGIGGFDNLVDTLEYRIANGITITIADSIIQLYDIQRTITMNGGASNSMVIGTIGNQDVFNYFDQAGNTAALPQEVRMVETNITALNPDVMLTPELVAAEINRIENAEYKAQEIRRVLRPAFWSSRRFTSRNLRR